MDNSTKAYEPASLKNALDDAGRTTLGVRMTVLANIMQRDRIGCALSPEEAVIVDHVKRAMMKLDEMSRRMLDAAGAALGMTKP